MEAELSDPQYIIGIDLGTTHSAAAYTEAVVPEGEKPEIRVFSILQPVGPGELKPRPLLPSFIFLPGPHDVPAGSLELPWDPDADTAVGEFARKRGGELPNRLVSSAKSWLCHTGVDRTSPILPWDAPPDVRRMSPVDASAAILRHIRNAWNNDTTAHAPAARFELQDIYLTVPASFDAVARELTVKAAHEAGLERLTLLEEPQAAFYSWIESMGDAWRKAVKVGESILVCDLGGGTTDFSLIQATEEGGDLVLRRVAVGDHILLGGDNMDLTLAYAVQGKLAQRGTKLDAWQFRGLSHSCRAAKEKLLSSPDAPGEPIVVLGRGTSLIGGVIRTELTRDEVESIIMNGFFPVCESSDYPQEKQKVGMREMGLPYASDPAVTRHLARFLGRQAETESGVPYPSAVLFNGGVMKSGAVRGRILETLARWRGGEPSRVLTGADPDLAVARGAAYYGAARRGRGIRIRGGIPRSYYIGIESSMPAVPGIPTPMKALCVVPFGMEEGTETEIRGQEFGLVVGEPAEFHLLASTVRKKDVAGEIVEDWSGEIEKVTVMETELPASEPDEGGTIVPIRLQSRATEVGTMELWCVSREEDRKWKLEFNLRHHDEE